MKEYANEITRRIDTLQAVKDVVAELTTVSHYYMDYNGDTEEYSLPTVDGIYDTYRRARYEIVIGLIEKLVKEYI